jgi:mannose-1-phosphate guanylyltransferase/mannose-6-phosphate isomerase
LAEAPGYNVKKLIIDPGCSSSIQKHSERSEHWVILSGMAKTLLNGEEKLLHPNDSLHIPSGAKHRIENPTTDPLVLIEVQSGLYLEEDDIAREEDPYLEEKPVRYE